ncbi:4'-phosphopantetheinyl transferase family protein [Mucilaginibacter jinjuensis]|uniref:4'-phosphopantetheinyl transferase superfamily protein n=1 Tax=Mucilaginibacter jinjuensis TaxID=1176721 RepID=A0ABY7T7S2_9SPHI|nr:4'-phosphopantetheinyl transferase superfamily protein [Mucilaginibacter jinjuensis]WCT12175.1 4'-phosphopantetheinyl transferase superfamily protein [Mucilaginibacter jinjuensis]
MISIGNDIVDLSAIDKNRTQQKAFYSKILSDKEQQLYSRSSQMPFEIYVWLLWSAKESVYKFAKRLNPELIFSPARIEIVSEPVFESEFSEFKNFQNVNSKGSGFDLSFESGEFFNSVNSAPEKFSEYNYQINYLSKTYHLLSLISDKFIATIASQSSDFTKINWGIKYIDQNDYESQASVVRSFTLKRINEVFPNEANFSIGKNPVGGPTILKEQVETDFKVSFAHHGNYVAYAFAT